MMAGAGENILRTPGRYHDTARYLTSLYFLTPLLLTELMELAAHRELADCPGSANLTVSALLEVSLYWKSALATSLPHPRQRPLRILEYLLGVQSG